MSNFIFRENPIFDTNLIYFRAKVKHKRKYPLTTTIPGNQDSLEGGNRASLLLKRGRKMLNQIEFVQNQIFYGKISNPSSNNFEIK